MTENVYFSIQSLSECVIVRDIIDIIHTISKMMTIVQTLTKISSTIRGVGSKRLYSNVVKGNCHPSTTATIDYLVIYMQENKKVD